MRQFELFEDLNKLNQTAYTLPIADTDSNEDFITLVDDQKATATQSNVAVTMQPSPQRESSPLQESVDRSSRPSFAQQAKDKSLDAGAHPYENAYVTDQRN